MRALDLLAAARLVLSQDDPAVGLRDALRSRLGVPYVQFVSTGRAALTLVLQALRGLGRGNRDEVIIPSYTCYSVAASVVRAGLKPRLVDIDPTTLDYDMARLERADLRKVLAIVATNLYGLPTDMAGLQAFASAHDLFLVDDAAQALGASAAGRASGTWGDAGLYSFDKGKNVSAIDGGVIVSSKPAVGAAIERLVRALPGPSRRAGVVKSIKLGAYVALLHPRLYWIPQAVPKLRLGTTEYSPDFPLERLGRPWLALALTMLGRLDEFTARRRANASQLLARLDRFSDLRPFRVTPDASPVYLRLPLLAGTNEKRALLLDALTRAGIGATGSYPASLLDVPELSGLLVGSESEGRSGREVASRLVTLPTHPYVHSQDFSTIESAAASVLTARRIAVGWSAALP